MLVNPFDVQRFMILMGSNYRVFSVSVHIVYSSELCAGTVACMVVQDKDPVWIFPSTVRICSMMPNANHVKGKI